RRHPDLVHAFTPGVVDLAGIEIQELQVPTDLARNQGNARNGGRGKEPALQFGSCHWLMPIRLPFEEGMLGAIRRDGNDVDACMMCSKRGSVDSLRIDSFLTSVCQGHVTLSFLFLADEPIQFP